MSADSSDSRGALTARNADDYGQNQGLYGSLDHYTTEIIRARGNSSSLIGSGITMEGMNQNELVYELTLDSAWSSSAINVTS